LSSEDKDIETILGSTGRTLTGLSEQKYSGKVNIQFNMSKGGITDAFMNLYTRMGLKKKEKKNVERTSDDK